MSKPEGIRRRSAHKCCCSYYLFPPLCKMTVKGEEAVRNLWFMPSRRTCWRDPCVHRWGWERSRNLVPIVFRSTIAEVSRQTSSIWSAGDRRQAVDLTCVSPRRELVPRAYCNEWRRFHRLFRECRESCRGDRQPDASVFVWTKGMHRWTHLYVHN